MVKKLESLAGHMTDRELVASVLESANRIWLAGLGAFAAAQEEGTKAFDSFVKQGEKIQDRAVKVTGVKLANARDAASDTWGKLEKVFEGRVARVLHNLNVPNKKDIDALGKRVAELTAVVEKLSRKVEPTRKPTSPASHRKPATRRSAA